MTGIRVALPDVFGQEDRLDHLPDRVPVNVSEVSVGAIVEGALQAAPDGAGVQ